MRDRIAIVGMACRYPDASSPRELWQNVVTGRRAFRRLPRERLSLEDYWSSDRLTPDATYSTMAAVIDGYRFDRVRFRVSADTYRAVDIAHWLALDVADGALADAGFEGGHGLPRGTSGVLVGNTLTGDCSRANGLRLRWPYVHRVVDAVLAQAGESDVRRRALLADIQALYKAPFPDIDGETLAGSLSNTIAGRICNFFDLKGGGYTIDGACASSLLAVAHACDALRTRRLDVALAGGVDLSLDPLELVGFAKAGALADVAMRVFDAQPTGFWPGEGCGFVVLMREADAREQGRPIAALICGTGVSSDGSGGMTRPQVDGQMLAIARAYAAAGYDAASVPYFEGHGTGTAAGDMTELTALSRSRALGASPIEPATIGSIKANIGHTKAAAGIAGLLKATLAVQHQVLPPTTGCERFLEVPERGPARLSILDGAEPWPGRAPLRAGVSAMGFGGINVHATIEAPSDVRRQVRAVPERVAPRALQDAELFVVSATDRRALGERLERLRAVASGLSFAEMTDLAVHLQRQGKAGDTRAAFVAASPSELDDQLARACRVPQGSSCIDPEAGLHLSGPRRSPRLAFLFSGQGAPIRTRGGLWTRRFDAVDAMYRSAALPETAAPDDTSVAQPAIVTASLAAAAVLERAGVEASIAIGHSVGEIAALAWSGALSVSAAIQLARARGQLMKRVPGAMAALAVTPEGASALLAGTDAVVAALNAPDQVVIAGTDASVERILAEARTRGVRATRLPVAHPFHSPAMRSVADDFRLLLSSLSLASPQRLVISTVTAAEIGDGVAIGPLLERQLTAPVLFHDALVAAGPVDLFVELGPGRSVASLATASTARPAIAVDTGGPSLRGLLSAIGAAFALGADVDTEWLAEGRGAKPFDVDRKRMFLSSPCELAPPAEVSRADPRPAKVVAAPHADGEDGDTGAIDTVERLRRLVARRTQLPVETIRTDSRFLSDLHLNSMMVAELLRESTALMKLPPLTAATDYADATIAQAAAALDGILASNVQASEDEECPAGVDTWVRAFAVREHEVAPPAPVALSREGPWAVVAAPEHPLRESLMACAAHQAGGPGTIVCVDGGLDAPIATLLEAARHATQGVARERFVIVHHGAGLSGFARSLSLEARHLDVAVVDVDFDDARAAERVMAAAQACGGFADIRCDVDGRWWSPTAELLSLDPGEPMGLGPDDVLLVTGGGKGIATECALEIARETGTRLAIVGRSDPEDDEVLASNLARLDASGAPVTYVRADVCDAGAVRAAVAHVRQTLGPVTAVIHAAGMNRPSLIAGLDADAVAATLAPKVDGARHVLAAVDLDRLRMFVTFGSVIARTGLAGEAHYALANERLRQLTTQVGIAHPGCRAMTVEWSVWAAAGMGERLGRIDTLARLGVTAIDVASGTRMLRQLLAQASVPSSVVVSGRLGERSTLAMAGSELPFARFLERPRVHCPGVELIADAELALANDPYLADHQIDGQLVVPAVMGLEAIAQCAMAVRQTAKSPSFSHVEFLRAVVVPRDESLVVRTSALVDPDGSVRVAVRSRATGFAVDHFRAVCRWPADSAVDAPDVRGTTGGVDGAVADHSGLYGTLLFQSGRFARLRGYRELSAVTCDAEIREGQAPWFSRYLPDTLVLGDPGARDTALHCVQGCIPLTRVVPVAVDAIDLRGPLAAPCRVQARQRAEHDRDFVWDVDILDAAGACVERWHRVRFRAIASLPVTAPPPLLLGPYVERRLASLGHAGRPRVLCVNGPQSASGTEALGRLLGAGIPVLRRPDGKPEVDGAHVSVAHADGLTLVVTAPGNVGCDLEPVRTRPPEVWRDLLGPDLWAVGDLIARERHESADAGATRIWAATESLKKAGAPPAMQLALEEDRGDRWVTLRAGRFAVSTWITGGAGGQLAVAIVTEQAHACV